MTTRAIKTCATHLPLFNTTRIITPLDYKTELSKQLILHYMSRVANNEVAIRVRKASEFPYTLERNTQVAYLAVLTPEQSKYLKPWDTTILQMMQNDDPDLTIYLNELLGSNRQK